MRIGMEDIVDMILQVNICKESVTYRELGIGIVTTSSMTLYYRTSQCILCQQSLPISVRSTSYLPRSLKLYMDLQLVNTKWFLRRQKSYFLSQDSPSQNQNS